MSNPEQVKAYIAETAITAYRIVKMGSATGQVVMASAAGDAIVGVADPSGQATVNARIDVWHDGIVEVEAGAAVSRGAPITSDATGRAVTAAPGAGTNNGMIGRTLTAAAAAGDIISVMVSIGSFQG